MVQAMARRERSLMPSIRLLLCIFVLLVVASLSILVTRFLDLELDPRRHLPHHTEHQLWSPQVVNLSTVPNRSSAGIDDLWSSKFADRYYGCSIPGGNYSGVPERQNGYLLIQASGGLNQQRIGITDAVVVAKILNATLVVPSLDHTSFWKDSSNFSDIFDVDWFISALAADIKISKELPSALRTSQFSQRVPRKSSPRYYLKHILPTLQRRRAVRLTKFDYRLANKLDTDLQKLRCRVNYNALKFTDPILKMGRSLVRKMKSMSGGRFIALHLRFEPDMLAFSGCYYGGGAKEIQELGSLRKRWKNLRTRNPERERRNGKCPLTPMEVGLMLRALGFSNETYLYVASGEIYGGERTLAPLRTLFPYLYTKETLASEQELLPFSAYSSRMAAIDYMVCNESDVFATNNNGNMARILAGHRRYCGHKRTIRPNAKKLGFFFASRHELPWDEFAARLRKLQRGFMGEPDERPARRDFFESPSLCICRKQQVEEQERRRGDGGGNGTGEEQGGGGIGGGGIGGGSSSDDEEQFNIDEVLLEQEQEEDGAAASD